MKKDGFPAVGDGQPWVQRLGAPGAGGELGQLVLGLVPALQQETARIIIKVKSIRG